MIRLGVIGLGTIFAVQVQALLLLPDKYQITAVYDNNPAKYSCLKELGIKPAITDSAEALLVRTDVDAVLIATPPATHYDLALAGLINGRNVLLEKPAVLSESELDYLYDTVLATGSILHIAYHASFALDLEWFLREGKKYIDEMPTKIECCFYDPYMVDGKIIPQKHSLGGCYIDSGVNALSVCAKLTDLNKFTLADFTQACDEEQNTAYSDVHRFVSPDCEIIIRTGWNLGINEKTTLMSFRNTKQQILLDHTNQSVWLIKEDKRELLFCQDNRPRLLTHYLGVFEDFSVVVSDCKYNEAMTSDIHHLLLS